MNPLNVSVVPAQPGHELIYQGDGPNEFVLFGQVIAWRIATWPSANFEGRIHSKVEPLAMTGEVGADCFGVQNPDGTVVMFRGGRYTSWEEFRIAHGASALSKKIRRGDEPTWEQF
jgi:hypothetical protein